MLEINCPKCDGDEVQIMYVESVTYNNPGVGDGKVTIPEHLNVECLCGFRWRSLTAEQTRAEKAEKEES